MEKLILKAQKNEATEKAIYAGLAEKTKDHRNKKILKRLSDDESRHYDYFKKISGEEVRSNKIKVFWYIFLAKLLGLSFSLKFMERGEILAIEAYEKLKKNYKIGSIIKDEQTHEKAVLDMIKEERIEYAGSVVLGLNDALVELTGGLAGLTLALQNNKIIAVSGFIIGVAAALSMAASGYFASKEEGSEEKNPVKASVYTGVAYLITVLVLILPYIILQSVFVALIVTVILAIIIIAGYTFYITTAKNQKFLARFAEMAAISIIVAIISFGVGFLMKHFFGISA